MQIQSVAPPSSTLEAAPSLLPLLHAFLRRRTPITRMEWLPIIVADADSPGTWPAVFGSLNPDDQCRILDVLLHPDSGSFADVLLIHLAANAGQIADEQVRQTLVHEVGTVWGRFEQKLRASTHYRDALTSDKSALRERGDQSLDLAAEIATAEVEVAALRAQEFETDEKFTRLHTFEQQQRELERRRVVLSMFDVEQAQEQVASLRQELEHSERLREELQNSLQSLEADLEAVRPQVVELEERQTTLTTELSSLEQRRVRADKSVADTEVSIEKLHLALASTQTRNNKESPQQATEYLNEGVYVFVSRSFGSGTAKRVNCC